MGTCIHVAVQKWGYASIRRHASNGTNTVWVFHENIFYLYMSIYSNNQKGYRLVFDQLLISMSL